MEGGESGGGRHYLAVVALEVGGKDAFVGAVVEAEAVEVGLDRYLPDIGEPPPPPLLLLLFGLPLLLLLLLFGEGGSVGMRVGSSCKGRVRAGFELGGTASWAGSARRLGSSPPSGNLSHLAMRWVMSRDCNI